jgi:hypothetical protein
MISIAPSQRASPRLLSLRKLTAMKREKKKKRKK